MNRKFAASVILGVAMAGTSALTGALTPKQKVAAVQERFDLEAMIPKRFGNWTVDNAMQWYIRRREQREAVLRPKEAA